LALSTDLLHPVTKLHILRLPNSWVEGDLFHVNSIGFATIKIGSVKSFAAACTEACFAHKAAKQLHRPD
jgi:hypothetical protein